MPPTMQSRPPFPTSFAGWTGACSGTGPCVVSIDAAKTVSASFARTTNTPGGNNISVTPTDPGSGTSPVTVTFAAVAAAGETTVTSAPAGPIAPVGYLAGSVYFDLDTTATFTGPIKVCFAVPAPGPRANDRLLHYAGTAWVDITSPIPPVVGSGVICGVTNSLSPFVIASLTTTPSVVAHGSLERLGAHQRGDDHDDRDDEDDERGRSGRYKVGASCENGMLTSAK